jgi:hypothetical protein
MSLCYDFSKWAMISLASIAISLTVGLVLMQVVHGQVAYGQETVTETRTFINSILLYRPRL